MLDTINNQITVTAKITLFSNEAREDESKLPLVKIFAENACIADILSIRIFEYISLLTAKMDFDEIFYR
jgi:hypothetical protein